MRVRQGFAVMGLVLVAAHASAAEGWKRVAEDRGVHVSVRTAGPGRTMVRGEGVIEAPLEVVRARLLELETYDEWISSLSEWRVLRRASDHVIAYGRHDLPWPMDDRDYVVRYRWKSEPPGSFLLRAESVTEGPAPLEDVVRLSRVRSEWKLVADGPSKTIVSYTYTGELGGSVPDAGQQSAWKSEPPALIDALRARVAKEKR